MMPQQKSEIIELLDGQRREIYTADLSRLLMEANAVELEISGKLVDTEGWLCWTVAEGLIVLPKERLPSPAEGVRIAVLSEANLLITAAELFKRYMNMLVQSV